MNFLILFFMCLALLTIIGGFIIMSLGGKINKKYSNKLMILRVTSQGLAILALFLTFLLA